MSESKHKCEELGCNSYDTVECRLHSSDDDDIEYYCADHCKKNGYCYGCGWFSAGIESFDFSEIPGLCYDCVDEFKEETGEYDWEYEDDFDAYDYY